MICAMTCLVFIIILTELFMKNIMISIVFFSLFNSIAACTTLTNDTSQNIIQWDFDHHLQFIQNQLNNRTFQLEVIRNNKTNFEQLAAFLLRKSYSLCGGYQYKLEMIQGIEGFDDKRAMPNYIPRSLIAKVECERQKALQ